MGAFIFVVVAAVSLCGALDWAKAEAQTFDATNLREPVDLGAAWMQTPSSMTRIGRPSILTTRSRRFSQTVIRS
jgi:hypothetical protein